MSGKLARSQIALLCVGALIFAPFPSSPVAAAEPQFSGILVTPVSTEDIEPEPQPEPEPEPQPQPGPVYEGVWVDIRGSSTVGSRIEIQPFAYNPWPSAISYQWFADGQAIAGASGDFNRSRSYVSQASDIGKRISVELRLTHPTTGQTRSIRSNEVGPISARNWVTSRAPSPGCFPAEVGVLCITDSHFDIKRTWSPSPTSISYQWFADGAPISASTCFGETNRCLRLTNEHLNKRITVRVTAEAAGFNPRSETSNPTSAVQAPSLQWVTIPTPQILGTVRVGETIRVSGCCGGWDPVPTATQPVLYQWFANGNAISGATQSTLRLTSAMEGQRISVRVSAGHDRISQRGVTTSPQTAAVQKALPPPVLTWSNVQGSVGVSGPGLCCPLAPFVGQELTANASVHIWNPRPTLVYYQWLADGVPISGATGFRLTLRSEHEGKRISLRVTGSHPEIAQDASDTSSATFPVQSVREEWTRIGSAQLVGQMVVGQTISVSPSGWSPEPTTYEYRWVRGGREIPGETSSTYVIRASDVGQRISVQVTALRNGLTSSVRAPAVGTVSGSRDTGWRTTPTPTISGTPRVGETLTASTAAWSPRPSGLDFQWLADGIPITGQTGNSYRLQNMDVNKRISIRVVATHPESGQTQVMTSRETAVVTSGDSPRESQTADTDTPDLNPDLRPDLPSDSPAIEQEDREDMAFSPSEEVVAQERLQANDVAVQASRDRIRDINQGLAPADLSGIEVLSLGTVSGLDPAFSSPARVAASAVTRATEGLTLAVVDFADLPSSIRREASGDAGSAVEPIADAPTRVGLWSGVVQGGRLVADADAPPRIPFGGLPSDFSTVLNRAMEAWYASGGQRPAAGDPASPTLEDVRFEGSIAGGQWAIIGYRVTGFPEPQVSVNWEVCQASNPTNCSSQWRFGNLGYLERRNAPYNHVFVTPFAGQVGDLFIKATVVARNDSGRVTQEIMSDIIG